MNGGWNSRWVHVVVCAAVGLAGLLAIAATAAAQEDVERSPFEEVVLPARVEAENFDNGPAGVVYSDTDPAFGNVRRDTIVDVWNFDAPWDGASGALIGRTRDGEFTEYTVTVSEAAEFDVQLSVASGAAEPGVIHVDVDGVRVGTVSGDTDRWFDWMTRSAGSVLLQPGPHVVRLTWDEGANVNFDWFEFLAIGPQAVTCETGAIEAEDGEVVGRFRTVADDAASGGAYVDVARGSRGWFNGVSDSFVEFCFGATTSGEYRVDAQLRTPTSTDNSFFVAVDDGPLVDFVAEVSSEFFIDTVNDAQARDPLRTSDEISVVIDPMVWNLEAGDHIVRFYLRRDGTELDWAQLVAADTPEPTATVVPSATPTATVVPSATATATVVPSATATATVVPSATPTATATVVPSATATATVVPSATATATATPTQVPLSDGPFAYSLGDVIDETLGSGSGNLEGPGAEDLYTFSIPAGGQRIFLDWQLCYRNSDPALEIIDAAGDVVKSDLCFEALDLTVDLDAGAYTVRIYSNDESFGRYQLQLFAIDEGAYAYSIGEVINEDFAPGAGNLEGPGAEDRYTFDVAEPQRLFINWQECSALFRPRIQVVRADGTLLPGAISCVAGNGFHVELEPGLYTIRIYAEDDGFGPYQLQVWDAPIDLFSYSIGDSIASELTPGAEARFDFTIPAGGQRVFLDWQECFGSAQPKLQIIDAGGDVVLADSCFVTLDDIVALAAGDYTLRLFTINADSGAYEFQLLDAPTEVAAYSIGDPIAGELTPGAEDLFEFTVAAGGQRLFVDFQECLDSATPRVSVIDAADEIVFRDTCFLTLDAVVELGAGDYTFRVFNDTGSSGPYQIQLFDAPTEEAAYSIGDPIAAELTPGAEDLFEFTVSAGGQTIAVDIQECIGGGQPRITIFDAAGDVVENTSCISSLDSTVELSAGLHTLRLLNERDVAGSYQLELTATS